MGFIFSGLFWGIILILLGISVIVNIMFHIHIPFFRIVIALILIYMGIRVLVGGHWTPARCSQRSTAVFSDTVCTKIAGEEFNVVFGRSTIDAETVFSGSPAKSGCTINTVFGYSVVRLPKSMPMVVRITALFSGARLPDGSLVSFGQTVYKNEAARTAGPDTPVKAIDMNVIFGGCEIVER